ncbi:hypothetical protein ACGFZA_16475 [Streptomyces sp. NPDC048211]|uniref:hypothetical protein n=1 Tax=Streptomyces sp. NPDC048211 TaxID=3365516 RepID=UPI000A5EDA1A
MQQQRRRTFRVRAGVVLATLCAAIGALLSAPAPAWAASCSGFGCDGHDPNIQTWQYGPRTQSGPYDYTSGYSIEMRSGTTDGDFYVWARTEYVNGSNPYDYSMYIERCHNDHTVCEILGETQPGTEGRTVSSSSPNYSLTRSPMYYDVGRVSRACLYRFGDWAGRTCTLWY